MKKEFEFAQEEGRPTEREEKPQITPAERKIIAALLRFIKRKAAEEGRRIIFEESEQGSNEFVNIRYYDKETGRLVSERIKYDPLLFKVAPYGAFYYLLWHEEGHGRSIYRSIEEEDIPQNPQDKFVFNIKYDLIVDADNPYKYPALARNEELAYEHFFPRDRERSDYLEQALSEVLDPKSKKILREILQELLAPFVFGFALKYEGFWKEPDPSVSDKTVLEYLERAREALYKVVNPSLPLSERHKIFNEEIKPLFDELFKNAKERARQRLQQGKERGDYSQKDIEDLLSKLRGEKESTEKKEGRGDPISELISEIVDKLSEPTPYGEAKEISEEIDENSPYHPSDPLFKDTYENDASESGKEKEEAKKKEEEKEKEEVRKKQEEEAKKIASAAAKEKAKAHLEKLRAEGIDPKLDALYQELLRYIPESALEEFVKRLVHLFLQERSIIRMRDRKVGIIPPSRMSETLRRELQGEVPASTREQYRIVRNYIGIDLILINDNSGSMRPIKKYLQALNVALARAVLRVNTEIREFALKQGMKQDQIKSNPPLRFLALSFSNQTFDITPTDFEKGIPLVKLGESRIYEEEKYATQMLANMEAQKMESTNDYDAWEKAMVKAYGEQKSEIRNPEQRIKIFIIITDGDGEQNYVKKLMQYMRGKTEYPEWLEGNLTINQGSEIARQVHNNLERYKARCVVLAIGLFDKDSAKTFLDVYNEGQDPETQPLEERSVILIPPEEFSQSLRAIITFLEDKVRRAYRVYLRTKIRP